MQLWQHAPLRAHLDGPPYFDANQPARHVIEAWDGRDETAEHSEWNDIVGDNTTALKQASLVRATA